MKLWRRRVALLLAALLLCALLPAAALAEEELDLSANGIDSAADEVEITLDDDSVADIPEIEPDAISGIDDLELSLDDAGLEMNAPVLVDDLSTDQNAAEQTNAAGDVPIDAAHFPDAKFRDYVERFDDDGDGVLSAEELAYVYEIDVEGRGITNLRGIEYFPALTELYCSENSLTNLDVSKCMALERLYCDDNQLTNLDVSKCTALKSLSCSENKLTSLDMSKCTTLERLYCDGNQLTNLDVNKCTALKSLFCSENKLTTLDVSKCTALESLECFDNRLTSLDVSKCLVLSYLSCTNEWMTDLNVSGCTVLKSLFYGGYHLTSLNVSGCTALTSLSCSGNQLTSLNVSGCTALEELDCGSNQLSSLDVSTCTELTKLWCYYNQLTSLNVSGCTKLNELHCYDNKMIKLDLTNCKKLVRCVKEGKCDKGGNYVEYIIEGYDGGYIGFDSVTTLTADGKTLYAPSGKIPIKYCEIKDISAQTYTGKAIKPVPVVKFNGKKLKKDKDYTVSYSNNTKIGTATVTIEGKGKYTDLVEVTFAINPRAVKLSSLTAGKNKLTVKWKKGDSGVKYELQYSLYKDFSASTSVTISKTATVKKDIKNLESGKKYYVRIRTFKDVKGQRYASAWSKRLSKTVK